MCEQEAEFGWRDSPGFMVHAQERQGDRDPEDQVTAISSYARNVGCKIDIIVYGLEANMSGCDRGELTCLSM